jgi:HEPN domain-containing protein
MYASPTSTFAQAERDLEQAADSRVAGRHEWACFAAHQGAEKAVKALHLRLGAEAWGHAVARLLSELPADRSVPDQLIEMARSLDAFYIPTRYPNGHPEGARSSIMVPFRARQPSIMPVRSLRTSVFRWLTPIR